ncbi:CHC2 zinc finger domain-containing protein [Holdemanella biformis]|uniref:CHC2 zinc finger domain-containing protein n=1 Tax=Holdemanella biformis TaxID=1735 RepID=UPI0024915028|nr:CHC2 zinc finger domain-containing protein [Holdemanella biformis]
MIIDKEKIQEAKEILGDQNAVMMAEMLQLEDFDEHNLKALCCFHAEDTPSLIYNPKNYTFHCFGCQKTVDIIDVFMQTQNCTYIEAVKKLFEAAGVRYSFGEANVKTRHQYIYPKEEDLNNDRTSVYTYLAQRGISKETADYLDIRADKEGNMVFNYYDTNDVLTMVKYRPSHRIDKRLKQPKCWCQQGADTTPLLYNINRINTNEPLIIAEGENDCAALIESGFHNAVSVPLGASNTHWISENWDWLEQFSSIIICSDNDEPGIKLQKEAVYRLGSWRTKVVDIPLIMTSKKGREVRVKDVNEVLYYCGKEAVINLIANAKDTPVPSVVDFSDVKEVDLSDIDGCSTEIEPIDKETMRLFYGSLTILSGTPGSGKTSFLCQLIAHSIDRERNVWLFSRELPDWMTKNWIEYILAGNRNITEYEAKNHAKYYKVNLEAKQKMSEFYRDKLRIYRDEYPNTAEEIKTSMIDSVRKYGSKLCIIDNLMTVDLGADSNNMNEKQTEFVNWLIQFAMKYNVAVVLVCHPRKLQTGVTNVGMYDISGSSNIINLAHRAFGLRRVTPKEKEGIPKQDGSGWKVKPIQYDVIFEVIKDRMRGKANLEVGLYYDVPSRRFYTNPEEYDFKFGWDNRRYTSKLPYPMDDSEVFGEVSLSTTM